MNVGQVIATLRTKIKEFTDDSLFEDEYLFSEFLNKRAKALTQRLKKYHKVSAQNYTTFGMKLEEGVSHEVGCITVGCPVVRTEHKIPDYLTSRNVEEVKLYTLDQRQIDIVDEYEVLPMNYTKIRSTRPYAILVNGHAVIFNFDSEAVQVRGLLGNPLDVMNIQFCENEENCINVYDDNIFADRDIVDAAIDMVITESLKITLSINSDMTNDANSEIKV